MYIGKGKKQRRKSKGMHMCEESGQKKRQKRIERKAGGLGHGRVSDTYTASILYYTGAKRRHDEKRREEKREEKREKKKKEEEKKEKKEKKKKKKRKKKKKE